MAAKTTQIEVKINVLSVNLNNINGEKKDGFINNNDVIL